MVVGRVHLEQEQTHNREMHAFALCETAKINHALTTLYAQLVWTLKKHLHSCKNCMK